jgi:dipeptidyl aminopeptidase/acylaminoacyl peptidase
MSKDDWRRFFMTVALVLVGNEALAGSPVQKARIIDSTDCFGFDTYDDWKKAVRDRPAAAQPAMSEEAFATRFPPEAFTRYRQTLECAFIKYDVNGVVVSGFFAKPTNAGDGKLPAVIFNRSGNGDLGRVNFAQILAQLMPLASRGFFVVGSQYRDADEFGGKDVDDVLALLDILDAHPDVAGDRIGMMGFSRGGIETVIAGARSDRIKAIALLGTPSDLLEELRLRPDMERVYTRRIPNYSSEREQTLRARSPLHLVERLPPATPILILHGGKDERAHPANALKLASRLQDLGREYKLVIYPGGDHAMSRYEPEVREELARWFATYLAEAAVR